MEKIWGGWGWTTAEGKVWGRVDLSIDSKGLHPQRETGCACDAVCSGIISPGVYPLTRDVHCLALK